MSWHIELRAMKTVVAGAVGAHCGEANLTHCAPPPPPHTHAHTVFACIFSGSLTYNTSVGRFLAAVFSHTPMSHSQPAVASLSIAAVV